MDRTIDFSNEDMWYAGFAIATKIYYSTGSLDIRTDAVTDKTKFPIGEWTQWNRKNVDKLDLFEINDLNSYGFIWDEKELGHHVHFLENYDKLKKYKTALHGLNIKAIEDEDLLDWVNSLPSLRKMYNNAYLTKREIQMLEEIKYPWGDNWPTEKEEDEKRKSKDAFILEKIRVNAVDIQNKLRKEKEDQIKGYKNEIEKLTTKNRELSSQISKLNITNLRLKDEKEGTEKISATKVVSKLWYEKLLDLYINNKPIEKERESFFREGIRNNDSKQVESLLDTISNNSDMLNKMYSNKMPYLSKLDLINKLSGIKTLDNITLCHEYNLVQIFVDLLIRINEVEEADLSNVSNNLKEIIIEYKNKKTGRNVFNFINSKIEMKPYGFILTKEYVAERKNKITELAKKDKKTVTKKKTTKVTRRTTRKKTEE